MRFMLEELRNSIRALLRRPFYPAVAVVILAVGLTACVAVFTYVNGFYQPFPGVDTEGLVRVFGVTNEEPYQDISYLDFEDYASADGSFAGIAATAPFFAASVRRETMTEVAFLEAVSGAYFSVLGIDIPLGRGITLDDDQPGAESVAVLSFDWWQRSFNGDPEVIGSRLLLNYRTFTIVGVMPREFVGVTSDFRPDVWIPIAPFADRYTGWARAAENRDLPLVRVFGRLRQGSARTQGAAELATLAAGLDATYPRDTEPRRVRVDQATWIDPRARVSEWSTVRLIMAAAGGLLILVCANVANLLLAVALRRQREMSVRAALGASRGRLIRQVILENTVLSVIAGGIALLLAAPSSARLGSYFARPSVWNENVAREISVDLRVVLFAVGVSILTGVIAGLLPALRASSRDLVEMLKGGRSGGAGAARRFVGLRIPGAHDMLVATQVALTVVLIVVAGLVLRTFVVAGNVDPGFRYDHLVVTHISTSSTGVQPEGRDQFFRETAALVAEEPWVSTATVVDYPLLSPHRSAEMRLDEHSDPVELVYSNVIPGFFEAIDIDVLRGRSLSVFDTAGATSVAVVNQDFVDRYYADQNPLGFRIWWPISEETEAREYEIVGVVRNTKTQDFLAPVEPTVYFSYPQHAYPTGSALMVAVNGSPITAVPLLNQWLRNHEPHLAIVNVVPYSQVVGGFLYTQRMNAELFSVLAFLGLGLAAAGIFSVMSVAVSRRTREIGIRMSVGAKRGEIAGLVIARALAPVVIGVVVGLAVSFAGTGLVRSMLFGVEPTDPIAIVGGIVILLAAALVAAYLPARRATKVDPVIALRAE